MGEIQFLLVTSNKYYDMKNVLLCGKNSYVGAMLIKNLGSKFTFTELDMREPDWKYFDFSSFDTIIYLAAIVHRPDINDRILYRDVNEILPLEVLKKAVGQGIKQIVFFSTMAVYGISPSFDGKGRISFNSPYNPVGLYGQSKLNAEIQLVKLKNEYNFVLTIVRPPNIYGENCPGNYHRYMNLCARYLVLFPLLRHNQFSMIHINKLSEEIETLILQKVSGVMCPQDEGSKSNAKRIAQIAKNNNWAHYQSNTLGKLLFAFNQVFPLKQIENLFGDMYYDDTLSSIVSFEEINYPPQFEY